MSTFEFEVDYTLSFEEMVAAGHYNWINRNFNKQNFPITGKGKKHFVGKLFAADCSSEDGIKHIVGEDKVQPWKPGEIEHILAFGAKFPDIQRETPVIGLGSFVEVRSDRGVPCLYGTPSVARDLQLFGWSGEWPGSYRLLGVREISDLSVA